jgi:hypothetical protein
VRYLLHKKLWGRGVGLYQNTVPTFLISILNFEGTFLQPVNYLMNIFWVPGTVPYILVLSERKRHRSKNCGTQILLYKFCAWGHKFLDKALLLLGAIRKTAPASASESSEVRTKSQISSLLLNRCSASLIRIRIC